MVTHPDAHRKCTLVGSRWRRALLYYLVLCAATAASPARGGGREMPDRAGTQWAPYLEWRLSKASHQGNPYDVVATATFTHDSSGERRTTGMYYDGGDTWAFRFTATRPGRWTFSTSSPDPDLDGHRGSVSIEPNPKSYGFVTHVGNKWARPAGATGELEAFVPQFVMYESPDRFHNRPDRIDAHIRTALVEHGFTGFHVHVGTRWFDLRKTSSTDVESDDPNPDPRTFEALELLITKTHAAGGVVHLWAWGDDQRHDTPTRWGINGKVDRRLQRYIAARLGPLPGWTMGYGFDLWEWVEGEQLAQWHRHLHEHFGWPHMLGARAGKNSLDQLTEALDYSSYEQHRPDYDTYVKTIERRPGKPSFSEDRFRVRKSPYPEKDYDMERTRRGLWQSALAGGVANIWGHMPPERPDGSDGGPWITYPQPHMIRTYSEFFRGRFLADMARDNTLTDGVCLHDRVGSHFLFYKEDATSIRLDLSKMQGRQRAVAVDARRPYREIELGMLNPQAQTWKAPYASDWAIAVGPFRRRSE